MRTARLQLVDMAPWDLLALLQGVPAYEQRSGRRASDGLRDFLVSGDVSPAWLERLASATETNPWQFGFVMVHLASQLDIGTAAFKGPPDPQGIVEIAYGVVPAFREQGYATEAAQALVAFAFGHAQVKLVRAHTLPELNASCRVLTKCGFTRQGEVIDPEDGPVWRWERPRPSEHAAPYQK